ncbi:hypothetical protein [Pseudothauera rhizosphaerae]|uniref:Uncharacterized protein n=1 Tax=Pseudothauera rhizosphaerae TaxID=2565932 RepID=A0A4S4AAG8_9RHOO|nr:hypothetical protein [Pseudothauera rhizosphaerae]THF55606.1 hypothetical protein E6O51_20480 [Pseudothauera rhizosphaerae]
MILGSWLALCGMVLVADTVVPPHWIDTVVGHRTIRDGRIFYIIPSTGGAPDSCEPADPSIYRPGDSITVTRSKFLRRCAVSPDCLGLNCSQPDRERLIQAAIGHRYPSIYRDLHDLRRDYPDFTPRIRRWSDEWTFLFGKGLYAVQMPEEEVIVTADGQAKTMRECGRADARCSLVAPRNPEFGIVGTVQPDDGDRAPAENRATQELRGGSTHTFLAHHPIRNHP